MLFPVEVLDLSQTFAKRPCIFPLTREDHLARLVNKTILFIVIPDQSQPLIEIPYNFPLARDDNLASLVNKAIIPISIRD